MMLAPVLTGSLRAGFRWQHAVLLVTWIAAYLGYMAVRGWLRSRRAAYAAPVATYLAATVIGVGTLVIWRPALVWWAIPLVAFMGLSMVLVTTGRERSVLNDALLMASSCLMSVMAATLFRLGTGIGWGAFSAGVVQPREWLVAGVFAGYFWGTIWYVKTMIRERGKTGWYAASVAYHVVGAGLACLVNLPVGVLGVVIALRAILVPRLWPKAKPQWIGLGEVGLTIAMIIVLCLTIPGS